MTAAKVRSLQLAPFLRCLAAMQHSVARSAFLITSMPGMAIRVVEFSNGGYKIRKVFA